MAMTRLDKLLSDSGRYTRSEARSAIRNGSVSVDGRIVRRPEEKFDGGAVSIFADGAELNCAAKRCFMLYKPAGVLSATDDPRQRTVIDLLPGELQTLRLFPVGRLDKDTTGLLLLTNDGDFAHRVISPRHHVPKLYEAVLDGPITKEDVTAFAEGIVLADGTQCLPAKLEMIGENAGRVTIFEGKYHQVKRMFAACGKTVTALHREQIGALRLDAALRPGEVRELEPEEWEMVFQKSL